MRTRSRRSSLIIFSLITLVISAIIISIAINNFILMSHRSLARLSAVPQRCKQRRRLLPPAATPRRTTNLHCQFIASSSADKQVFLYGNRAPDKPYTAAFPRRSLTYRRAGEALQRLAPRRILRDGTRIRDPGR